jgi:D-3-phosphoglycerate dehydrogenase / 2-oxoglutarate reductase
LQKKTPKEKKMSFKVQTLNKIAAVGLNVLDRDNYEVASDMNNPDAYLVRSADMHEMKISDTVKAVARAGAGTNNIPIPELTEKGVVVFNTPGANANAVKELVMLALLLSSRPVIDANKWANGLAGKGDEIPDLAEKGKSQFVGPELKGKTLGVIGLGAIGAMVANLALKFGMDVVGYDPFLSVKAALALDHNVKIAETLDTVYAKSDYITIHVPQTNDTKGMINSTAIKAMKDGVRLINIARGGLVNNADVLEALNSGKIKCMITDFASEELLNNPKVIVMPHLGASTPEAEDNCAVMAANELKDFLEKGIIVNSVNFPKTTTDNPIPTGGTRLCISHQNVPDIISKFTTILGEAKLNIAAFINQARGDIAYNIIDVDGKVSDEIIKKLEACDTVKRVRPIFN